MHDDILIYGSGNTMAEARVHHDRNMFALLNRCHEKGIRLSARKLELSYPRTLFLGYELTAAGIHPDHRKVATIQQMPAQTNLSIMCLLGMTAYLIKFCPNFSDVTASIRQLLSKDVDFRCDDDALHGAALQIFKVMLTNASVLSYYDVSWPILVQCDSL